MSEEKRDISPFEFHTNLRAEEHNSQFVMDCPFCGGEQKFYFNSEYQWDCKRGSCGKSGNVYQFIRNIYDMFDNVTKSAEILATVRGLPREYFVKNGIKHNDLNGSFLIPAFKHDKVHNLYKAIQKKEFDKTKGDWVDKWLILATPGIDHMLIHWLETSNDTLWIGEGHWDKVAGDAIIGNTNPITMMNVPGAGVWKPAWCEALADKDIVFMYDNDKKGQAGFERVILQQIAKSPHKPKSISYLAWPEGLPDGYDLNDVYKEHRRQSFKWIQEHIKPYSAPENAVVVKTTIETIKADTSCDSFDKLLDMFKSLYHVTPDMEMALACLLASAYSINIEGEQLWYKIIGPPGCGKTTLAKMMSSSDRVVLRSTFTGLFSGWKDDSDEDASMVPLITNKMLVVKDADALLRQPNVERIFSELRDFYDKDSSTQYKNRVHNDYRNIRCTMVLCGTNVLRRADSSFLGERFLDLELGITRDDEERIKYKMLEKSEMVAFAENQLPPDTPLMAASKGFIDHHLLNRTASIRPSQQVKDSIYILSTLISQMRTKVDRDSMGKGEVTFTPVVEVPSRLIGQLMKLAICLPVVTGNDKLVMPAIRKIAKDIIDPTSSRFKISQILCDGYFNRDTIVENVEMSRTSVTRFLDDLRHLNFLDIEFRSSSVGRRRAFMTMREDIKKSMKTLGL